MDPAGRREHPTLPALRLARRPDGLRSSAAPRCRPAAGEGGIMQVTVLGAGSWGTTVATLVAQRNHAMLWARSAEHAEEITKEHTNSTYLPGYRLPQSVSATSDLEEAVRGADVLIMGIPSQSFRDVLVDASRSLRPWVPVVSLTKGLERGSHLRMTQVIEQVLPEQPGRRPHRAEPGQGDHGWQRREQRRGHPRPDARAGPARRPAPRPVPRLHQRRRGRLRARRRPQERHRHRRRHGRGPQRG